MRKLVLVLAAACALLALAPGALGASGDLVKVVQTDGAFGVSVAFDGKYLYYTDWNEPVMHRIDPLHRNDRLDAIPIVGADGINAFTFDATRSVPGLDRFWGVGDDGSTIYLITVTTTPPITATAVAMMNVALELAANGLCDSEVLCQPLVDGIGYDGTTDTIWFSPDGSQRIYQFDVNDDPSQTVEATTFLRGWFDVNDGSDAFAPQCTDNQSSGVAAGANLLYLTDGNCVPEPGQPPASFFDYGKRIWGPTTKPCPDLLQTDCPGDKHGSFQYDAAHAEDDECDDVTFNVDVMWIRDGVTGFLYAYEVDSGTCIFGGGVSVTNPSMQGTNGVPGRMTGGGYLMSPSTGKVHTSFMLHCNSDDKPNRLEVTWGGGNHFHMDTETMPWCTPSDTPVPNSFSITGTGTGRYNNKWGATCAFTFTDNGEPGSADTGQISVKDASGTKVAEAPVSVAGVTAQGPLIGGNYQWHS